MFGGVSSDISKNGQKKHDPGGKWINAAPDRAYGWNNEYFEFDLDTGYMYVFTHTYKHTHTHIVTFNKAVLLTSFTNRKKKTF